MRIVESITDWAPISRGGYVCNREGQVMTFYHGTNKRFLTSDFRPSVGSFGLGIYFSNNKGDATCFGKRIITARLKMSNPYYTDGKVEGDIFSRAGGRKEFADAGYDGVLYCLSEDYIEALVLSVAQIEVIDDSDL